MIIHFNSLRTQRELAKCPNLTITVRIFEMNGARTPVKGVPEAFYEAARGVGTDFVLLRVGPGLLPASPLELREEGLFVRNVGWRVLQRRQDLLVPWDCLTTVEAFFPPTDGGTHSRRTA
jgi:hypothetical protein